MPATLNIHTQVVPSKLYENGDTWIDTSINQNTARLDIPACLGIPVTYYNFFTPLDTEIYLHDAAPTEPAGDGSINETDFTGQSVVTYSAVAGNYIKSFTSEAVFFTVNQDFATHNVNWVIHYIGYYTGTPTSGYTPYIKFEFYKRNTSNVDTLLFDISVGVGILVNESSVSVTPTGSVTTSDRLRIRCYGGEEIAGK